MRSKNTTKIMGILGYGYKAYKTIKSVAPKLTKGESTAVKLHK